MPPSYEHRQIGKGMLLVPIFGLLLVLLLAGQSFPWFPILVTLPILLLTASMLSSLKVSVDREQVLLSFGPGFPRRVIPLAQIASARVVTNPAWMGLGIHFIPNGMIYNVSGREGVEILLVDGRLARVGTDEADDLVQAITRAKEVK
jgi:hypothetical protein